MKNLVLILFVAMWSVNLHSQVLQGQGPDMNFYLCKAGPEFKLVMPNIFTPNGDYVNDHFLPRVDNEICLETYYLGIYNRWGQLLYESSVYSMGWHGNTFYGDPYPEGTYYYRMNYTVKDANSGAQKSHAQNGVFQLVR